MSQARPTIRLRKDRPARETVTVGARVRKKIVTLKKPPTDMPTPTDAEMKMVTDALRQLERTRRRARQMAERTHKWLTEHSDPDPRKWPPIFYWVLMPEDADHIFAPPLAIGAHEELAKVTDVDGRDAGRFLFRLTDSRRYKPMLVVEGARRYHLDGTDAGPVTEPHRARAAKHTNQWFHVIVRYATRTTRFIGEMRKEYGDQWATALLETLAEHQKS